MQVDKRWVIRAGDEFVGIDSNSGGYFYYTDFWDCRKFGSLKSAQEYANCNWGSIKKIDWEIYATDEIGLKFVQGEPDPYEIELAALKKKYGLT